MFSDKKIAEMEKYIKSLSFQDKWELIGRSFGMWAIWSCFDSNNSVWFFSNTIITSYAADAKSSAAD